jgi:hypothetical protein
VNTGSDALTSFLRKNHTFYYPAGGSNIGNRKYGSIPDLDRTKISTLPQTIAFASEPGHNRVQKK